MLLSAPLTLVLSYSLPVQMCIRDSYIGFMGATSWEGFYLQEADGTVWHTAKSGSTATPFFLTTDAAEGTWDLWFPGQSGCYYTNVNTTKKLWTALWMPTLNVSGIDGRCV